MMREQIIKKLQSAFQPQYLDVIDESYRHQGGISAQSHFKAVIVSNYFLQQNTITRHRAVYRILIDELASTVHALALHTYTVAEWQESQFAVPNSPACRGITAI